MQNKMYNVYNKSNIYFLYNNEKKEITKIGNQKNLIAYVASCIVPSRLYWKPRTIATKNKILRDIQWQGSFIREQNLTGKDTFDICQTERKTFARTTDEGDIETYYSYYNIHTKYVKPFTIINGYGRIVDARIVLPDAIKLLTQDTYDFERLLRSYRRWHPYVYRSGHTCYQGSHGASKRTHIQHEICKELNVPYRVKTDRFKKDYYWRTRDNRTSTGWKHNKDKHQWDHNLRNHKNWRCNSPKNYWLAEQEKQFAEFELEDAEMFGIYDELSDVA